jgi:pyridoxal phosphate enzyme (YggS family)
MKSKTVENYKRLRESIPKHVDLVVAAKTRTPEEIEGVIAAGATIIGENYVQEARSVYNQLGDKAKQVRWHIIGHLQRNKVKNAVEIFDMIETVDSVSLAEEIDKRCKQIGKIMPVLVEINSGKEAQKTGIMPEDALGFTKEICSLSNIKIMGVMTMGPRFGNPEDSRPYFVETRKIFEKIKTLGLPNVELRYLSMGMTNSYRIAIEEGSNMVRIGTAIFGEREY